MMNLQTKEVLHKKIKSQKLLSGNV